MLTGIKIKTFKKEKLLKKNEYKNYLTMEIQLYTCENFGFESEKLLRTLVEQ